MVDPTIKQRLAELEAATPNLMDLSRNPEWLRLSAQLEEECDYEVGAGYAGAHLGQLMANPAGFTRMRRLQNIALREFKQRLIKVDQKINLGNGLDTALACGRQIVLTRLSDPSPEIQQELLTILSAYEEQSEVDRESLSMRVQQVLQQVLSEADWETIVKAASESWQTQVLDYLRWPESA